MHFFLRDEDGNPVCRRASTITKTAGPSTGSVTSETMRTVKIAFGIPMMPEAGALDPADETCPEYARVVNAKYLDQIRTEAKQFSNKLLSPRSGVFSVSDTGVGLPAEKMDRIFSAFFTTKPQGSGMGLAISRSIVESHGGQLRASPNDGPGATFHFSFPIATYIVQETATGT